MIGILTYHRAINTGSFVQAVSAVNILKERYPKEEIEVLNYCNLTFEVKDYILRMISCIKGRNLQPLLRLYHFRKDRKKHLFESPIFFSKRTALKYAEKKYNELFIGSDTVFEQRSGAYAPLGNNVFHGTAKIKCIGLSVSADPINNTRQHIERYYINFAAIYARDSITYSLLNEYDLIKHRLERSLDPTFYSDKILSLSNSLKIVNWNNGYNIVGISLPKQQAILVNKVLKELNFKTYDLRGNVDGADYRINNIGPAEELMIYRHFFTCVSDRFHSSIFTMRISQRSPIGIINKDKWKGDNKLNDLYKKFNLENQLLSSDPKELLEKLPQVIQRVDDIHISKKSFPWT